MQVRCEVKEDGNIHVSCFSLKTDSWLDHLAFKQDARTAFARNDCSVEILGGAGV